MRAHTNRRRIITKYLYSVFPRLFDIFKVPRKLFASANWRAKMGATRAVGRELARAGLIDITQGGVRRDPDSDIKGPWRFRAKPYVLRRDRPSKQGNK